MAHKLWLQYASMLSNHCNSRKLVSAIFSRFFWNITCLDLECKQCKPELDIMYYSAMANCLNYPAYIPFHIPFVSGRVVCQQYVILNYSLSYPLVNNHQGSQYLKPNAKCTATNSLTRALFFLTHHSFLPITIASLIHQVGRYPCEPRPK